MKVNKFSIINNFPIVLASKSNIRKKLLRQVGLSFKVVPSNLNEKKLKVEHANKSLTFLASKLASEKAKSISKMYEGAYVIGADQICVLKNKPLGKPKNINNAIEQLCSLNGLEHKQISAFSIYLDGKLVGKYCDIAILKMRKLTKKNIINYIKDEKPINSCGSYKYESKGILLFSKVSGSIETIKGLPLLPLLELMHNKSIISYA